MVTQISQQLHQYLLGLNAHIDLYNRMKNVAFSNNEILNYLVQVIKNIVINNPGSEVAVA